MRAKEFLIKEASVITSPRYVPGHRLGFSTSKTGAQAAGIIQKVISDFDPSEIVTIADPSAAPTYTVTLSKGTLNFKVARSNKEIIELQGSKSAIEGSFNDLGKAVAADSQETAKMPNKGDTAEGLLGAALFAKLMNRQSQGQIGQITTDDVWNIFDNMKPYQGDDYYIEMKDVAGAKDKIWFRLKVKNTVKLALKDPTMRKGLNNWLKSPVNYVNSPEGTEYAEEFYKNGTPDEIGVVSDGISAQKDKKTDVMTAVKDPVTGMIKREVLPISLKAGADQFAQHSGGKWKAMTEMFALLGVKFPADPEDNLAVDYEGLQGKNLQIQAASKVYSRATDIINSQFKSPKDEAVFIKKVADALRFWATNNDDSVKVVSFGRGGQYDVLQFDVAKLIPAMKKVQLRAKFVPGENPKLEIYDEISKSQLFQIRTYLQTKEGGKYQRNVVEKGPLLSMVADATGRYQKAATQPTQAPVQQPVRQPLGNKAAQPAKLPTKAKVAEPVQKPGDQMGAEPQNTAI
jgi:hypothetical protein